MAHHATPIPLLIKLATNYESLLFLMVPLAALILEIYLFAQAGTRKHQRSSDQKLDIDIVSSGLPIPPNTGADTHATPSQSDPLKSASFAIEAMVSSGPRKSAADYAATAPDLCEDAAGVVGLAAGRYAWWLCDGTSDGVFLPPVGGHPGLSTRQFARAMGDCFVSWIIAGGHSQSDISPAVELLRARWHKRLIAYLRAAEDAGHLGKIHETFGGSNGTLSSPLKWSSTFIGGVVTPYSETGSQLQIYQVGDCGGLVVQQREPGLLHGTAILPATERIIALSTITGTRCEVDMARLTRVEHRFFESVIGFSAMSDGVIYNDNHKMLSDFLIHLQQSVPRLSMDDLREGLVGLSDRSYDDKSMIIGWVNARPAD